MTLQKFNRRGQKQYGIDLIGTDADGKAVVVQCKLRNTAKGLPRKGAEDDVEAAKELIDSVTGEKVHISRFVIATTDDVNDHTAWAANVTREHKEAGLFEVKVYGWRDFCAVLNNHPDLSAWYLGELNERSIYSTVPTPSATFIKRPYITRQIHDALQNNLNETVIRQAVARAMGGYGKTVAAILYADEYKNDYPGGRFFLPVEAGELAASLASLITPLGLTTANNPKADATLVARTLHDGEPSLLILDNVASKAAWGAMLDSGLVPRGTCRVLITTRDEAIDPADAIRIGRLTNAEAAEVFALFCTARHEKASEAQKRAGLPDALPSTQIVHEINEWLGGLAVAIAAVAAFMKLKPHIAWHDYWEGTTPAPGSTAKPTRGLKHTPVGELPDVRPDVAAQLGLSGQPLEEHRRTLRVIDDAYDALRPPSQTTDSPEQRAIQYAALLPQDLAPGVWLEQLLTADAARHDTGSDGSPDPLRITLVDDPDEPHTPAQAVLQHLDRLDIVLPSGEGGRLLSLHRLWHARVNERASAEKLDRTQLWSAIDSCAGARWTVIVGTDAAGKRRGLNNPAALTDASLRWELTPLQAVCIALWAQANAAKDAGDEDSRVSMAGAAAEIGFWLSILLKHLGRFVEAEACLSPLVAHEAAVESALGPFNVAVCHSSLFLVQRELGKFSGALASIYRAISIAERVVPADSLDLAAMRVNLALLQKDEGNLQGARTNLERALRVMHNRLRPEHADFATVFSNLAMIELDQGDIYRYEGSFSMAKQEYEAALVNIVRAIGIEQVHFPPDHPTFATRYSNLALIQRALGDPAAARASIERAIAIKLKRFDPDHPTLATSYSILSLTRLDQGNQFLAGGELSRAKEEFAAARASMEPSIAIKLKHFAADDRNVAISYSNLADIAVAEGNIPEAVDLWRKAYPIWLKALGPDRLQTKLVAAMLRKYDPPGPP
ncbi:MAG: tetratricopeptide repeat protein [Phycisphaerales bacterium]|nr:tetratricopeptide repeat protein [Phycisphaerales bacterium]